jgi:hypothetical protein
MPTTPTYPRVYIDELPSTVRTIIGVPASIAAFVGTAPRGAIDRSVHVTNSGRDEHPLRDPRIRMRRPATPTSNSLPAGWPKARS